MPGQEGPALEMDSHDPEGEPVGEVLEGPARDADPASRQERLDLPELAMLEEVETAHLGHELEGESAPVGRERRRREAPPLVVGTSSGHIADRQGSGRREYCVGPGLQDPERAAAVRRTGVLVGFASERARVIGNAESTSAGGGCS